MEYLKRLIYIHSKKQVRPKQAVVLRDGFSHEVNNIFQPSEQDPNGKILLTRLQAPHERICADPTEVLFCEWVSPAVDSEGQLTKVDDILEEFERAGRTASFHYADDSGQEWNHGDAALKDALKLFDKHPQLHDKMRLIALSFLWSLKAKRPQT
jgi:hypothetical protein